VGGRIAGKVCPRKVTRDMFPQKSLNRAKAKSWTDTMIEVLEVRRTPLARFPTMDIPRATRAVALGG